MNEAAIIFDNVWKSYPSYFQITGGIKSFLFNLPTAVRELRSRRTALEGINFTIYKGEKFGFIGHNGAGKSTTLGLIAGVLNPDQGTVQVNGRVSPLLELGAGFHPEMTGRANILLNGVLLGLTKEEVLAHEQEIIDFAELGEFIDMPVRTYSSGMYAKLGFAVVTTLKPEILLLDEVLAVGDIGFQQKCKKVFENFKKNPGVTMILVSHSLESVVEVCDRVAWIEGKTVKMIGTAQEVVTAYKAANKDLLQAPDIQSIALPPHIRIMERELDCSAGTCTISPEILSASPDALLRVTLTPIDGVSPLKLWLLPAQPIFFEPLDGDIILRSLEKNGPSFLLDAPTADLGDISDAPFRVSFQAEVAGVPHSAAVWLPLYPNIRARQEFLRQQAEIISTFSGTGLPPHIWQGEGTVRIVARNVMKHDAVGNFAVELAATLQRSGIAARIYAYVSCTELTGIVAPIGNLQAEIEPNDLLFYHYSTEDEFLPHLAHAPFKKKILYYHNITPGSWFRDSMPDFADALDRAREQFKLFPLFDVAIANSSFSLDELLPYLAEGTPRTTYPPTMRADKFASITPEPIALPAVAHRILWVGRIAPHKRPELALKIFEKLSGMRNDTALIMVAGGRRDMPHLTDCLEKTVDALPSHIREKIIWLEGLTDAQLAHVYGNASLLLSTSGHEGYCLPVREAMNFCLPVAALPQPAVEETLDGRGTILPEDIEAATVVLNSLLQQKASEGSFHTKKTARCGVKGIHQ